MWLEGHFSNCWRQRPGARRVYKLYYSVSTCLNKNVVSSYGCGLCLHPAVYCHWMVSRGHFSQWSSLCLVADYYPMLNCNYSSASWLRSKHVKWRHLVINLKHTILVFFHFSFLFYLLICFSLYTTKLLFIFK